MQVGNEWQYGRSLTVSTPNGTFGYSWLHTQRVVSSFDSLGVTWYVVRDSTGPGMPVQQPPRSFAARYDAAQRGVVAPSSSTTFCLVGACYLDTAIGQGAAALEPGDYLLGLTSGGKRYTAGTATVDVVDSVGMIRQRTSNASMTLVYVRVGAQSYGTSRTVDAEALDGASAMTLHPSVTRTAATLRLAAPSTVEAFDVTGRRVYRAEAAVGEHRIDVSAWSPGVYVVRAGGATRRLVVAR